MKQAARWSLAAIGALTVTSATACVLVVAGAAWWAHQKH
jgi:hypothetical protein